MWFADDADAAIGTVSALLECNILPTFGFLNYSKTFLIVKSSTFHKLSHSDNTDITVAVWGQQHLGAALGSQILLRNS